MVAGLAAITALALYRLRDLPYPVSLRGACAGIFPVLPQTGWEALKVALLWAWSAAVIAGVLLAIDPALGAADAILAGTGGLWVAAYLLGNLLGPMGLLGAPVIWVLLAGATLWLWRKPRPLVGGHPSPGLRLALLAGALLAILILPIQLGSPVVPVGDALCWPSSVQRILTFHVYAPFDNVPYGRWGRFQSSPPLELLLASLAIGTHTRLAVVAESAAMLPMAAMVIAAVYKLGRTLLCDVAGGIAALLVFATTLIARAPSLRPSVVDFVLVGLGLGFFFDTRRSPTRLSIGALLLGTSIAADVIHGAFAMAIAGIGAVLWLVSEQDQRTFMIAAACLVGALLIGATQFPIALASPFPYPILPISQLAGSGIIITAARLLPPQRDPDANRLSIVTILAISATLLALVLGRSTDSSSRLIGTILATFPALTVLGLAGLLLAAYGSCLRLQQRAPRTTGNIGLAAFCVFMAVAAVVTQPDLPDSAGSLFQTALWHFSHKLLEYWWPYFLLFPAALCLALIYDRWSRPVAVFAILAILIVPWHLAPAPPIDDARGSLSKHAFNLHLINDQSSLLEQFAYNLNVAAEGKWVAHPDPRWVFGPAEFALLDVLNREIDAGRITIDTHILHVTDKCAYPHFSDFSVFSGINDDPMEYQYAPDIFSRGGRDRGIDEFGAAAAGRPPYVLYEVPPDPAMRPFLDGYEEIFHQENHRLFRRKDLAPRANPLASRW